MAFILEVTIDSVLQCVSCMGATFFQDKYSEKWHQYIQASTTPSRNSLMKILEEINGGLGAFMKFSERGQMSH